MKIFSEQVYEIVAKVPYGRVVSYGQIAWMVGSPFAARAVGQAMSRCPDHLPWHRVVTSNGSIAKSAFSDVRKALLQAENVPFSSELRVDIAKCRWSEAPAEV